jgi:hypothetical protein
LKVVEKTLLGLAIFSIAMGYLESAVVIYLRLLLYPTGFNFPLAPIPSHVALIEFFRELATLIMLAGIAWFAGKNRSQRFAYFLFCFGIWDICYYVFLKLLLDWPQSFFTWDILFLIPLPWVGPVIAPCIVSLTMILYTIARSWQHHHFPDALLDLQTRWALYLGSTILVVSFIWDYIRYIFTHRSAGLIWRPGSHQSLFTDLSAYKPEIFDWLIFWIGEALVIWVIVKIFNEILQRAKRK